LFLSDMGIEADVTSNHCFQFALIRRDVFDRLWFRFRTCWSHNREKSRRPLVVLIDSSCVHSLGATGSDCCGCACWPFLFRRPKWKRVHSTKSKNVANNFRSASLGISISSPHARYWVVAQLLGTTLAEKMHSSTTVYHSSLVPAFSRQFYSSGAWKKKKGKISKWFRRFFELLSLYAKDGVGDAVFSIWFARCTAKYV